MSYIAIDMVSLYHNKTLVLILGTAYILLSLVTFYYGYLATKIDPTDPTVALERRCKEHQVAFDSEQYEYHCQICDSHVLAGSKHCG